MEREPPEGQESAPQRPGTPEELVSDGGGAPGLSARIAAAVALAGLLATGVVDAIWPLPARKLVGAEAARDAEAAANARADDGSLFRRLEETWARRSRVRALAGPWAALAELHLGHVDSEKVVLGPGGWLFQTERYPATDAAAQHGPAVAVSLLEAARRRFHAAGTRLIALPLARKETLCNPDAGPGSEEWAFDERLFADLRARGIEHVDTLELWASLAPRDVFRKFDNHWALPAERALADRIAAQFPELATGDLGTTPTLVEETVPYRHNLLDMLGLDSDSAAVRFIDTAPVRRLRVEPPELEALGEDRTRVADVALVGSSFNDGYSLWGLLVERLRTPVLRFAFAGTLYLRPLALLAHRPQDLPRCVLYEFPAGFASHAPYRGPRTSRSAGGVFQDLGPGAVHVLADLTDRVQPGAPRAGRGLWLRAQLEPGWTVATSDGALGLRLETDADARTEWLVRTADVDVHVVLKPDRTSCVVPILSGTVGQDPVRVLAKTAASRAAGLRLELVADVDPGSARSPLREEAPGSWTAAPALDDVPPLGTLVVRWDRTDAPRARVVVRGEAKGGQPLVRTWSARGPELPVAFVGVGGFAGGAISEVLVEVPGATSVDFGVAPAPVRSPENRRPK
ncbi:MAG: hypothetical protein AAFU73_10170 [Planctomycetota bacterium]